MSVLDLKTTRIVAGSLARSRPYRVGRGLVDPVDGVWRLLRITDRAGPEYWVVAVIDAASNDPNWYENTVENLDASKRRPYQAATAERLRFGPSSGDA